MIRDGAISGESSVKKFYLMLRRRFFNAVSKYEESFSLDIVILVRDELW